VNFHSVAMVRRLVESLSRAQGCSRLVISCVDNSQSEQEFAELSELQSDVEQRGVPFLLWQSPTNSGYAAGNNAAAARLQHHQVDILLVVNPDVLLHRGDLHTFGRYIISNPGAISTARTWSGRNVYSGLSVLNRWTSISRRATAAVPVGALRWWDVIYPGGHFIAMSMVTWRQLGGMCEDFFLFAEEADLTVRALQAKMPVLTTDLVEVIHDAGGTTGGGMSEKPRVVLRNAARSAVLFSRKHNTYRTWMVVASRLTFAVLMTRRQGFGAGREVLRGVRQGLVSTLGRTDRGAVR
jgi:GT2 family glycosyltransferase